MRWKWRSVPRCDPVMGERRPPSRRSLTGELPSIIVMAVWSFERRLHSRHPKAGKAVLVCLGSRLAHSLASSMNHSLTLTDAEVKTSLW